MTKLVVKIVSVSAIMILLLARVPEVLTTPQFWADEGSSFFRDALCYGHDALFTHYSGYYHVIPRFIAYLVSFAPTLYAPSLYIASSFMITAVVLSLILSDRLNLPCKYLLAISLVLVPHDGEVFANLTNIQWILAIGVFVMVFMEPAKQKLALLFDAIFVTLAGLTGPYIVTLLPVFIVWLWRRWYYRAERLRLLILSVLALVTSSVQMYSVQFTNEDKQFQYASLIDCLKDISSNMANMMNIALSRIFGSSMLAVINIFHGGGQSQAQIERITTISICIFLLFLVMLTYDLIKGTENRSAKIATLYFAAVMIFAAFYRNKGLASSPLNQLIFTASDRYFYIPKVMMIWLLLMMAVRSWIAPVRMFFLLIILVTTLQNLKRTPWMDLNWKYWAPRIVINQPITVPINPIGWKIDLICP